MSRTLVSDLMISSSPAELKLIPIKKNKKIDIKVIVFLVGILFILK